jgi:DNA-binding MurR/RpiR family transcriptional regulator
MVAMALVCAEAREDEMDEQNAKLSKNYVSRLTNIERFFKSNEKKIHEFISGNSADIIHMSITEAAERSGVSEAALVRFAKKLGYKGFQAMKISIAQDVVDPAKQIFQQLSEDDTIESLTRKVFASNIQSLNDTVDILSMSAVERAIETIAGAKRLLFYGIGGSGTVALDAQHKFLKIGYLALAFTDANIQAMAASVLGPGDVVVAISHSGASRNLIEAVSIARDAGATIIVLTNFGKSPILKFSDIHLFTSSPETAFNSDALASRIAELAILDALFVGVAFRNYSQSQDNIRKTRKALDSKKF